MKFASSIYDVPRPIIAVIIAKAFIEVLISYALIEFTLLKAEVKRLLLIFKT